MPGISHLEVPGVWVNRFDVGHKFTNLGLATHIAAELVKSHVDRDGFVYYTHANNFYLCEDLHYFLARRVAPQILWVNIEFTSLMSGLPWYVVRRSELREAVYWPRWYEMSRVIEFT